MKKFTIIALTVSLLASFPAIAKEDGKKAEKLSKHKSFVLPYLKKEEKIINGQISCIDSATDKKSVSKCNKEKRVQIKNLKSQKKAEKQKMTAQR
ncbi:MAG: hypothetical protein ACI9TO_000996, partial [Rickettsiales bacterium]